MSRFSLPQQQSVAVVGCGEGVTDVTGIMVDYLGTRRLPCPDCGERLTVPHDYAVSAFRCRQDPKVIEWAERILHDHALEKPILHPTVLASRHLLRGGRL